SARARAVGGGPTPVGGRLTLVGRAMESSGVSVRSAHVSTLGANAVDSLYVVDPDGKPLPPPAAAALAAELEAALR
ncbi:hypothetical protein ACFXA3_41610, partial [Streptomyces sp. NPDC059456]|uniref:hypothetical protein n=1 Tax=Streptomyces sp. NPDC059456 TaxID=3346838 RepID=UPI00367E3A0C